MLIYLQSLKDYDNCGISFPSVSSFRGYIHFSSVYTDKRNSIGNYVFYFTLGESLFHDYLSDLAISPMVHLMHTGVKNHQINIYNPVHI